MLRALLHNSPGLVLRAMSVVAPAIFHASGIVGNGIKGEFEQRGTRVHHMDADGWWIGLMCRVGDRLTKAPHVTFNVLQDALGQWSRCNLYRAGLKWSGLPDLSEAGACAGGQQSHQWNQHECSHE